MQASHAAAPRTAGGFMVPDDRQLDRDCAAIQECTFIPPMVDMPSNPATRNSFPTTNTLTHGDDGRVTGWLGSPFRDPADSGPLVRRAAVMAHQRTGAAGGVPRPEGIPAIAGRVGGEGAHGQHRLHVLHSQARRHKVPPTVPAGSGDVVLGHRPRHHSGGPASGRNTELPGGQAEQSFSRVPRVGNRKGVPAAGIPSLGISRGGPVRHGPQQEMPVVRLQVPGDGLTGGRDGHRLVVQVGVRVSSSSLNTPNSAQAESQLNDNDPACPVLGEANLDIRVAAHVPGSANPIPGFPPAAEQRRRADHAPRPLPPAVNSLAPEVLEFGHLGLSQECLGILSEARAVSTRRTYKAKWRRFCAWCRTAEVHPVLSEAHEVLPYLLHLAQAGLQHASIRVHLAAVTAFRRRPGVPSLFTVPVVKRFLRGLLRAFPPVRRPVPAWDLNLVLAQLMKPPFEPMHSTDLKLLSWKLAFVIAITSARRVSELQALSCREPFLRFHRDKVVLRHNPKFLPKVVSDFHLNGSVSLPTFFANPSTSAERALHSLDARRLLRFYLQRTADIRKADQLFVAFGGRTVGDPVTKQTVSRWIVSCIKECYSRAGKPLPGRVTAHSTRGMAATAALMAGVSVQDICGAARWRSLHTFARHYCLDVNSRQESAVGQAVLRNLFV